MSRHAPLRASRPRPSRRSALEPAVGPKAQKDLQPQPLTIRSDYKGAGKLAGKVALISGGDSGIGRAVAVHFAREGSDVAFVYLAEHADANETRRQVEAEGRRCLAMAADAARDEECRTAVERTVRELGRLDILVNNVATQSVHERFEEIRPDELEALFANNVFPAFFLVRHALAHLREGACIINTGSVTSFRGHDVLADYSATKGAIEALTYSLARHLAPRGIRVNGVAPGPIWTPLITSSFPDEQLQKFGKNTLMKRAGQPSEVAPAYVYLACADASYVTGQFVHINGGGFIG